MIQSSMRKKETIVASGSKRQREHEEVRDKERMRKSETQRA
jgi:hypothetical protein